MQEEYLYCDLPTPLFSIPFQVDHLQSELSKQYLQYREERDARKLLIWQLNELKRVSVKEDDAVYAYDTGRATVIQVVD